MMKRNPAHLLLATATIFMIAGLLGSFTRTVDVHLHDTMFVITWKSALIVGAIFQYMLWGIYLMLGRWEWKKSLTWVHVCLTIICVTWGLVTLFADTTPPSAVDAESLEQSTDWGVVLNLLFLLLAQLLFLVNLVVGLFKNARS